MRNLKKILALVMALVMSLSLVTIANAADFTDNDDISYEEAADVMSTIGVIEGFEDGSFDPDGTLTREQAAKLVTYMLLGDDAENIGMEGSTFNDVAATRWSAPAIEYCASLGIIDGAGDGNFYPAGTLTGVAFAKVLLTAIGYDSDAEGLVGTTWSINTSALAAEVGLDNGIEDLSWSAPLTREQAAQMALNALQAPLVAYEGGVTVIVGDTPVSFGSGDAYYITTTLAREQRISDEQLSNSDDYTVEFGERYFPRLRLIRETDEYERPSHTWVYENTELGTYVDYDLLVETYTEGVDGRTLFELLGRSTIQDYSLTYYVDGAETDLDKDLLVRSNTSDVGATGNGVLTQVFVDHDDEEIIITSINTYLAVAISDYSETNEYASVRVYYDVDETDKDAVSRVYNVDVADVAEVADVTADTFYAVNLSYKDDPLIGEVAKIGDVEVMEDCSITGYSSDNGNNAAIDAKVTSLTTGGEDYDANEMAIYNDDILYRYNENLLTDNTYTIYLDQYGYFLGVDLFEGSQNYVFITGFDRNSSNLSVKTATATGIFLDGDMRNIQVNVTATDKNIDKATGDNQALFVEWATPGYADLYDGLDVTDSIWARMGKSGVDGIYDLNQWYTYTVNEDGVYTLKPAVRMTWSQYPYNAATDTIIRTDNLSVADDHQAITSAVADLRGYVYGNDDTVFLTVDLDVVDTSNGARAITDVNGVYTGVQSVDLLVDTENNIAVQKGQVYTVFDSNGYVIAAVVIGEAQGAVGNYAYILSQAKREELTDGTYYWTFDAILEGEKQTLTARGDYTSTIGNIRKGDVVELRFDGDYVVEAREIDHDDIYSNIPNSESAPDYYSNNGNLLRTLNGEDIYYMINLDDVADPYDTTLDAIRHNVVSLERRTLYITSDRSDRGLAIAADAKAVVIQTENRKEVVTNCASVEEAISRLADPVTNTSEKEYDGNIVAILNSNGAAEWVVFVSDTPLTSGNQGGYQDEHSYATLGMGNRVTAHIYGVVNPGDPAVSAVATEYLESLGYTVLNSVYNGTGYTIQASVGGVGYTFTTRLDTLYKLTMPDGTVSYIADTTQVSTVGMDGNFVTDAANYDAEAGNYGGMSTGTAVGTDYIMPAHDVVLVDDLYYVHIQELGSGYYLYANGATISGLNAGNWVTNTAVTPSEKIPVVDGTITVNGKNINVTSTDILYKATIDEAVSYLKAGDPTGYTGSGNATVVIVTNEETNTTTVVPVADGVAYTMPAYDATILTGYAALPVPDLDGLGDATAVWSGTDIEVVDGTVYAKRGTTATLTITTGAFVADDTDCVLTISGSSTTALTEMTGLTSTISGLRPTYNATGKTLTFEAGGNYAAGTITITHTASATQAYNAVTLTWGPSI